jgi:hypothetical protein
VETQDGKSQVQNLAWRWFEASHVYIRSAGHLYFVDER